MVAAGELPAVDADGVFGRLIHALARRVLPHERGIAVAARAGRDDLSAGRFAAELFRRVVRTHGAAPGRATGHRAPAARRDQAGLACQHPELQG
jgi:hypothetical protein